MLKIGVTGGIGSGKSYVCHILHEQFGLPIYDCDSQAKFLMESDINVKSQLIDILGPDIYAPNGSLQRQLMAERIFANPQLLKAVELVIHPLVGFYFMVWSQAQEAPAVVVESAILHSSGMDSKVDCILHVEAPLETRIQRVIKRNGCTRQQVEERIQHQTATQPAHAHFVVHNDGTHDLVAQLRHILSQHQSTRHLAQ